MDDSSRINVSDARALADRAGKDWVIIIGGTPDDTQFVTWGRSPQDKVYASNLSKYVGEILCGATKEVYEDFQLDAAKNKARVEELEGVLQQVLVLLQRPAKE